MMSFGLLFYAGTIVLVSNIFINTGQMMGERFLFHPSFGFAIVIGSILHSTYAKLSKGRGVLIAFFLVFSFLAIVRVATRIPDWKDESSLYKHDVRHLTQNSLAHCNAAAKYMDDYYAAESEEKREAFYQKAMYHANQALIIYPEDEITLLNLGLLHFNRGEFTMAEIRWNIARTYTTTHPSLKRYDRMLADHYYKEGLAAGKNGAFLDAAKMFRKVIVYQGDHWNAYYYMGGAFAELDDFERAGIAWEPIKPITWLGFDAVPPELNVTP
jgi:tetratricopeptide (TPR) repeat protein